MLQPLDFYNNFDQKLLKDYVLGNLRIESAIINLSSFIPEESKNILDIGCGIGWSSYEFSKKFKSSLVEGIDLSPILIENASKLFKNDNLSFQVFDITKNLPDNKFDAIVMIDVYEHISISERRKFHDSLKSIIKKQGRIILACPSKFHQLWLKENKPEGLQPVDEDIDFNVINDFAKDIGGEVIFFQYKRIWRNMDYFYAVIEIEPQYGGVRRLSNLPLELESRKSRQSRVKNNLNLFIELPKNSVRLNKIKWIKNQIKKVNLK